MKILLRYTDIVTFTLGCFILTHPVRDYHDCPAAAADDDGEMRSLDAVSKSIASVKSDTNLSVRLKVWV